MGTNACPTGDQTTILETQLETKTNFEAYVETNLETYARHSATTTILEAKLEAWIET